MSESRDPKTCPSCGTVNPWLNEKCRSCGSDLSEIRSVEEPGEEPKNEPSMDESHQNLYDDVRNEEEDAGRQSEFPNEEASTRPSRRRWNILWIVIGILMYLGIVAVGEIGILKGIVAPNSQLRKAVEEVAAQPDPKAMSEEKKLELRSLLFSNVEFVIATIMLLLATPILIGGVVGYFSKGALEGAASMGLAAVLLLFNSGQPAYALAAGPIYAVLGWVGALGGYRIYRRVRTVK